VTISDEYHYLDGVGLNPSAIQRPIPIWIGCGVSDLALRRVALLADGWIPRPRLAASEVMSGWARVAELAQAGGRDPSALGLEVTLHFDPTSTASFGRDTEAWARRGADRIAVSTMGCGVAGLQGHTEAATAALELIRDHAM
jgi:alkanesulfonate monooxygenase SsuD/methylene tetrahydromethanopterin reductase-like flavin-dependent oxidoreductase (luciferase family)